MHWKCIIKMNERGKLPSGKRNNKNKSNNKPFVQQNTRDESFSPFYVYARVHHANANASTKNESWSNECVRVYKCGTKMDHVLKIFYSNR